MNKNYTYLLVSVFGHQLVTNRGLIGPNSNCKDHDFLFQMLIAVPAGLITGVTVFLSSVCTVGATII